MITSGNIPMERVITEIGENQQKKRKKPYVNICEAKEKSICEEKKENALCVDV